MPASQTLSVYLPKDLWERVQAAEADPSSGFKATEFCKNQLAALFANDDSIPALDPADVEAAEARATTSILNERPDGSSLIVHSTNETQQLPATEGYEYEYAFQDTVTSATAYLNDIVTPQGGSLISAFTDAAGRQGLVIGWPKQTG